MADAGEMQRYPLTPTCSLALARGDITLWSGDAIVNAANERMLGGGGVDGAIHRAAGPGLRTLCAAVAEVRPGVRCPTGDARITAACGGLLVRYVIHTVGPIYQSAEQSAGLLGSAYQGSLSLANKHGLRQVAFPAISCGVFGYPHAEAAEVALRACRDHAGAVQEITFVLHDEGPWRAFNAEAGKLRSPSAA